MKLLTNPIFMRMAIAFIVAMGMFIIGVVLIIKLRREMTAKPIDDKGPRTDSPSFALATYHGVIERMKLQEAELRRLRDAESQRAAATENISAAILSNLSSGVVLFNQGGLVQQANQAAKQILGYASPGSLRARELFRGVSVLRSGTLDPLPETIDEAIGDVVVKGSDFRQLEAEYDTPGGEHRVLGLTLSPVRSAEGKISGAACLITDLTDITALSRQVRLRENLAALGEMSAGIAHEFKNSLATISGYGQMLQSESDPKTVHDFAGKITAETAALSRVVTDFLNFAKPQALSFQYVGVRPLLEDCARECRVEVDASAVPMDFSLLGDETALRQTFSNLIRNSAEACKNGTPARVQVTAEDAPDGARLVFRDNSGGMDEETLSKIFIPFFTTKAAGTGLGLALVHRIVAEHGGSITVSSDGTGTTFTLSFPARNTGKKAVEQD